jgi:hypothetical protein
VRYRFLINKKNTFQIYSIILVTITIIANCFNFSGEDISNSRNGYLSGSGNDFLGAFSSLFYGLLPNFILEWWQYLIVIQGVFSGVGLYLIFCSVITTVKKRYFVLILFFQYFCMNLSIAQSRDGIMLSSIFLLIGIITCYSNKFIWLIFSPLFVIFTFSFRPWLTIALFPILYYGLKIKFTLRPIVNVALCLLIVIAPSIVEISTRASIGLQQSFPQQTVMIHDLATSLCLSPIQATRVNAYEALKKLESYNGSIQQLCNSFKLNTWQSSVTSLSINDPFGSNPIPPLKTIQPSDEAGYKMLEKDWLKTILSDPKTYTQNHIYFLTQVLISGESQEFKFLGKLPELINNKTIKSVIELYHFPWKFIINMHLISPLAIYVLLLIFYIRKNSLFLNPRSHVLFLVLSLWITITTLGFISDNGRYTYLPVFLILTNWVWEISHRNGGELRKLTGIQ